MHGYIDSDYGWELYTVFSENRRLCTALSIRTPRGAGDKIEALYVEVDSIKRGRRRTFASQEKVDLNQPAWQGALVSAILRAYSGMDSLHTSKANRIQAQRDAEASREAFGEEITKLTGTYVGSWQVLKGAEGAPVGISRQYNIHGNTAAEVVAKMKAIEAILMEGQ